MPERGIPKDAEYVAELKETSLDAAAQVLSGLAVAKRLLQAKEQQLLGDFQRYTGIDPARAPALGDLLLSAGRLHAEHVRTLLTFQRWVSDRVLSTVSLPASGGTEPAQPVANSQQILQGCPGDTVTQDIELGATVLAATVANVTGYTQVNLRPGVRAYLDWKQTPQVVSNAQAALLRLSIQIDAVKLARGTYTGLSVINVEVAGEARTLRAPFELRVST